MEDDDMILKKRDKKTKIKRAEEAPSEEEIINEMEFESTECPKCRKKKVISWTEQTRASDEPPTRFYKCMECSYTWREYS